jgi:chloride channel protein, CIC family
VEVIVGTLDQTVLSGVVVAAALAALIEHTLLGSHPIFTLHHEIAAPSLETLPLYAALGVFAGFVAVGFNRGVLGLRAIFARVELIPGWAKPATGGLVTGLCAVLGLCSVQSSGIAGGGYMQLSEALNGTLPLVTLLVLGALKFAATSFSYASGGCGGLLATTLFVGAMLGGGVGSLGHGLLGADHVAEFALVGMGAMFAGVVRAPLTSVLIIFEMTGGYALVLPLMIANTMAYAIARRFEAQNLYDALLAQDGVHLPQYEMNACEPR